MIIPIHHEEEIPMMNCWEWYVFAKYWSSARACMSKEQYDVIQEHNAEMWQYIWLGFIWLLVVAWIITAFINR